MFKCLYQLTENTQKLNEDELSRISKKNPPLILDHAPNEHDHDENDVNIDLHEANVKFHTPRPGPRVII